jgi:hypothetical protein|tara:strand:+ start:4686 stop:4856 length:171 start_codon:yes stop_codon:yes gene_type:complete
MRFELTTAELKKNSFGKNDILISKVKVTEDDGTFIKFAKLNQALLDALKKTKCYEK